MTLYKALKLIVLYIANRHVMKEIILAKNI